MKTYNNLYHEICSINNLANAWREARKGKTKKLYVIDFEQNTRENLLKLHEELKNQTYSPEPLKTFILRDPKTRKISKSAFRDRIVHHALVRILEPIFDKIFIYDNCASRKNKGTLFAINRFDKFQRKVTQNLTSDAYCLKADIKHYFQEINHKILLNIIKRKIKDEKVIWLVECIVRERERERERRAQCINNKGLPLGNLTSQFFANIYLNELDYFIKYKLNAKYYIRYVDDFVILHKSKSQLEIWKKEIDRFLNEKLKLELHPEKSKIISLSEGIDFVGFRNFYHYKLIRKRNIRKMLNAIKKYYDKDVTAEKLAEIFQGWDAYAKWANNYKLRKKIYEQLISSQILFS